MGVVRTVAAQEAACALVAVLEGTAPGTLHFVGEDQDTGQLVIALGTIRRCSASITVE